jgi:hypothetical protein
MGVVVESLQEFLNERLESLLIKELGQDMQLNFYQYYLASAATVDVNY